MVPGGVEFSIVTADATVLLCRFLASGGVAAITSGITVDIVIVGTQQVWGLVVDAGCRQLIGGRRETMSASSINHGAAVAVRRIDKVRVHDVQTEFDTRSTSALRDKSPIGGFPADDRARFAVT